MMSDEIDVGSVQRPLRVGLHAQIAETLRREILKAKPGDRLDQIGRLAKRFGISTTTARNALLALAGEGLVEIRHGSGTYVKQRAREKLVGVLVDLDISHPRTSYFYRRLVQQARSLLEEQGLHVKLYLGRRPPGEVTAALTCGDFLEDVAADRLCGAIIAEAPPFPAWLDLLKRHRVPCVGTGGDYPWSVGYDFLETVRQGTRHLLEQGRRNIALLAWNPSPGNRNDVEPQIRAFRSTMEEYGAPFRESWVRVDLHPCLPGAGWGEFREIWASGPEKPDGLLICDDMLLQDVVAAILEIGIKVPERLLVVSHNNRGSGMFCPFPVVRMEMDPDLFAQVQVEMLLKLIRQEPVTEPHVIIPFRWGGATEHYGVHRASQLAGREGDGAHQGQAESGRTDKNATVRENAS